MRKISHRGIIHQCHSGIENYVRLTEEIGMWDSEQYVIEKYIDSSMKLVTKGYKSYVQKPKWSDHFKWSDDLK